jgi:hypothetical protein
MNDLEPFSYPSTAHERRHGPKGYSNFSSFKPWLRDEFVFRCVYCLNRERWYPDGSASFSVDHLYPKTVTPERENDYTNLVYSCHRCNSLKQDRLTLDPTITPLSRHLRVDEAGNVRATTPDGAKMIDLLQLNHPTYISRRVFYKELAILYRRSHDDKQIHNLYIHAFGYPDDLPDLNSLKPPLGNSLAFNVRESHHARKMRGELNNVH